MRRDFCPLWMCLSHSCAWQMLLVLIRIPSPTILHTSKQRPSTRPLTKNAAFTAPTRLNRGRAGLVPHKLSHLYLQAKIPRWRQYIVNWDAKLRDMAGTGRKRIRMNTLFVYLFVASLNHIRLYQCFTPRRSRRQSLLIQSPRVKQCWGASSRSGLHLTLPYPIPDSSPRGVMPWVRTTRYTII